MSRTRSRTKVKPSPAKQLAGFIEKFDPKIARLVRATRRALRKRLPTAIEQVYDNYNFLAIGFCTTERTSDCITSLAVSAKGVALSFVLLRGDIAGPRRNLAWQRQPESLCPS